MSIEFLCNRKLGRFAFDLAHRDDNARLSFDRNFVPFHASSNSSDCGFGVSIAVMRTTTRAGLSSGSMRCDAIRKTNLSLSSCPVPVSRLVGARLGVSRPVFLRCRPIQGGTDTLCSLAVDEIRFGNAKSLVILLSVVEHVAVWPLENRITRLRIHELYLIDPSSVSEL